MFKGHLDAVRVARKLPNARDGISTAIFSHCWSQREYRALASNCQHLTFPSTNNALPFAEAVDPPRSTAQELRQPHLRALQQKSINIRHPDSISSLLHCTTYCVSRKIA
jgi:hypothetical protein